MYKKPTRYYNNIYNKYNTLSVYNTTRHIVSDNQSPFIRNLIARDQISSSRRLRGAFFLYNNILYYAKGKLTPVRTWTGRRYATPRRYEFAKKKNRAL